jgi:DNA helicase-2/ATP-dependent DNA helicase PcrA
MTHAMSRSLTAEQQDIVNRDDGAFLVIAPPGSGKTTIVTERVLRFAAMKADFRILVLTFTRKAAGNIVNRLGDTADLNRVTAQTIHAFCHDVLRNYGHLIDLADFTIYDKEEDRISVLREGLELERLSFVNDDRKLKDLLESIGRLKRDLVAPWDAPGTLESAGVPLNAAYEAYDTVLRRYGAADYDDLLFATQRLVSTDAHVRDLYRTIFRYVMVDEAQDTSLAQYEIIRSIFCDASHSNVMFVADADQSIFQFAGANVEYLLRFEREFKAGRCGLTQNFRCSRAIVEAANKLIQHNPDRLTTGVAMSSAVLASGLVLSTSYSSTDEEAKASVKHISSLIADGLPREALYLDEDARVAPEEICVLGRVRHHLDAVRRELDQIGIAYQFSAGRDSAIFESPNFVCIEAGIRWRINANDGMAKRTLARCLKISPNAWNSCSSLSEVEEFLTPELREVLAPLRSSTNALATGHFLGALDNYVRGIYDENTQTSAASDLELLKDRWSRIANEVGEDALARLEGEIALLGSTKLSGPGIRVLTIHAAKGLEFRAVLILGMSEGGFPYYRSLSNAAELIEERRSAYVAFTRAERMLLLSRCRVQRTKYGTFKPQQDSQFIAQAGLATEAK